VGLDKLKAQDEHMRTAQEAARQQDYTLDDADKLVILRLAKQLGYTREPKPLALPAARVTFQAHNIQHIWGFDCWDYMQRMIGEHAEHGQKPKCYQDPNRNDITFWWLNLRDCGDWVQWAKAERAEALERYPTITIFLTVDL